MSSKLERLEYLLSTLDHIDIIPPRYFQFIQQELLEYPHYDYANSELWNSRDLYYINRLHNDFLKDSRQHREAHEQKHERHTSLLHKQVTQFEKINNQICAHKQTINQGKYSEASFKQCLSTKRLKQSEQQWNSSFGELFQLLADQDPEVINEKPQQDGNDRR